MNVVLEDDMISIFLVVDAQDVSFDGNLLPDKWFAFAGHVVGMKLSRR